ncbi:uncharacterized protein LOC126549729 isoform X2 [Aphis gossypii]|uniref:uncharacterized protein LOC126549729 isoform X1 n=1 Tax=Aphis gossypii TaxID=80765 RepID=UPI0021591777|nr:uncharacterized protein LOC126549729 isoform X1 [Aphis gossypii]XP_050055840.1 uncharacterized protein LOC126549729 isoform X2 [Aphis gossypii]
MANISPNTSLSTSNNNDSDCTDELQVAETSNQSTSLEEQTTPPALSAETDPEAPAECLISADNETPAGVANLELQVSTGETLFTPALSTGPLTTEVKAVEIDLDAPAEYIASTDSETPTGDTNLELQVSTGETLFTPALSTGPLTTEVKAVEIDLDAPAEYTASADSEIPAGDANLEMQVSTGETLFTPALSTGPLTTEVKAVEIDLDAPAEYTASADSEIPAGDANLEMVGAGDTLFTPALSTEPFTTEVKAVEIDLDAPAEYIDSEAPAGDANLELVCRLEEVRSITPGPYCFRPIKPEPVQEPPYDDDDREVACIFGLDDETVQRKQKRRRFLSVIRSAVQRTFRAVCCCCVKPDLRDID